MDITNIPNELYREITDKDGQKIVFDFQNLDMSKDAYVELTDKKYNELKNDSKKRNVFTIILAILSILFFILTIVAFFYKSSLTLLFAVLDLIFIVCADGRNHTYDYRLICSATKKYRDVNMHPLDIMQILGLEEKFKLIEEILTIDKAPISKIDVNDKDIKLLYADANNIPHTISFTSNNLCKVNIHYRNIDYILIFNEVYGLSISLPLKYSEEYQKLVS